MDLHPIIVHFPIALLTVYAIMELIWSKKLRSSKTFLYIKATFLIIGLIGSYAALSSGEIAEDQFRGDNSLIDTHEMFANMSTNIFLILTIAYMIQLVSMNKPEWFTFKNKTVKSIWKIISKLKNVVIDSPITYILAILGLTFLTITGALGGALVYGPDADPIVAVVTAFIV